MNYLEEEHIYHAEMSQSRTTHFQNAFKFSPPFFYLTYTLALFNLVKDCHFYVFFGTSDVLQYKLKTPFSIK